MRATAIAIVAAASLAAACSGASPASAAAAAAGATGAPGATAAPAPASPQAAADVAAWEARWAPARACLVGDPPRARDAADAVDVARFATQPDCGAPFARLAAPAPRAPAGPAVADAWAVIDRTVAALAPLAGAAPVDYRGEPEDLADRAPALRDVDDADAALRAAVGLPPPSPPGAPLATPVALPQQVPAMHDVRPDHRNPLALQDLVAVEDGVAYARVGPDRETTIIARGPDDVRVRSAPHPASPYDAPVLSPDLTWGAARDREGHRVRAGAVDAQGALAAGAAVAATRELGVEALVGAGDHRAIVLRDDAGAMSVVRSTDGGAHWGAPVALAGDVIAAHHDGGWIDLVARSGDGATTFQRLTADGTLTAAAPAPGADIGHGDATCSARVFWWIDTGTGTVRWIDGARSGELDAAAGARRIASCAGDVAAVTVGDQLYGCTPAGCGAATPFRFQMFDAYVTTIGADAAFAAQHGHVVMIGRTGAAPRYLHVDGDLVGVTAWSGALYLALVDDGGLHFARVP